MSVASKNPFAVLEAEDTSRPSSPVPAPKELQPPALAAKAKGGPASRGGRYYPRGGNNKSLTKDAAGNLNQNGIEEPVGRKFEGRGRGGRARGGRGAGGGRGRQFDKHSQTGKTDSDKKIHQSWGGDDGNTELKTEEAANVDAAAESATNDWNAPDEANDSWGAPPAPAPYTATATAPSAEPQSRRRERESEEDDSTLTLDQYLAKQKEQEAAALPKLEGVRQVEGSWNDVVPLQKGSEDTYFIGKTKAVPKTRAKKEEKVFLDIEARFERPSRGGPRGRIDRGRGRGRGGRGGSNTGTGPSFDVDDQQAFPSLS